MQLIEHQKHLMSLQFQVIIGESKMQDSYIGTENESTFCLVNLFEEDDEFDSEDYGLKSLFEEDPDCIETSTIGTSIASTFSFDNDQPDDTLCLLVCLFVYCLSVVWVITIFVSMIVNFFLNSSKN